MKKERAEKIYLYGKNALVEVLSAKPDIVTKVYLDSNTASNKELVDLLGKNKLAFQSMKENDVGKKLGQDAVHQGVIASINVDKLYEPLEEVLKSLENKIKHNHKPSLVVLDELQDPHNVGAIIRSAVAFGVDAVLLPEHNQAPITGTVIKTSVGMVFKIPIVKIGNVNQTLRLLKEKGFWVYGLAMEGSIPLSEAKFDEPSVFVVGNEGEGIRQKTLDLCDITLSIPIDSKCESLNASIATSVVLYEWSKTKFL